MNNYTIDDYQDELEVEVEVTLTVHGRMKILVDDYTMDDTEIYYEDGQCHSVSSKADFTSCDFDTALREQIQMPDGWELIDAEVEYNER